MSQEISKKSLFSLLIATALAGTAYFAEKRKVYQEELQYALKWSQQIAAQVQVLMLSAQELHHKDPADWAVKTLNLGPDNKLIQVSLHPLHQKEQEIFQLDLKTWFFEYTRIIKPETKIGIRIKLNLGYHGFLGTRTPFMNDLVAGCFLIFVFFLIYSLFILGDKVFFYEDNSEETDNSKKIQNNQTAQLELGIYIKNVLKEVLSQKESIHQLIQAKSFDPALAEKIKDSYEKMKGHLNQTISSLKKIKP